MDEITLLSLDVLRPSACDYGSGKNVRQPRLQELPPYAEAGFSALIARSRASISI